MMVSSRSSAPWYLQCLCLILLLSQSIGDCFINEPTSAVKRSFGKILVSHHRGSPPPISPAHQSNKFPTMDIRQRHGGRRPSVLAVAALSPTQEDKSNTPNPVQNDHSPLPLLPCGDEMDKKIVRLAFPAIIHYAVSPLVGTADTYWVGRLNDALALAGQSAANSVYNSAFWILSFLPSIITPLIAKAHGIKDKEAVQARASEAIVIATIAGLLGTILLTVFPSWVMSLVLSSKKRLTTAATTAHYAIPFLRLRSSTLVPALLSTVSFAIFRGSMDVMTPLKITAFANLVNILLDPLMILTFRLGAQGAAVATNIADVLSIVLYLVMLTRRGLLQWDKVFLTLQSTGKSFRQNILPLLTSGASMQLRSIALHTAIISIAKTIHALDTTGTAAAAHSIALQMYLLGSVSSMSFNMVSTVIIPVELAKAKARVNELNELTLQDNENEIMKEKEKAMYRVRSIANRLITWGSLLGLTLSILHFSLADPVIRWLTPIQDVRNSAKAPALVGAMLQFLNALVFVFEGIQQGTQSYLPIAISTAMGTTALLFGLNYYSKLGYEHTVGTVWACYVILAMFRLFGASMYHYITGPLAPRMIRKYVKDSNQDINSDWKKK